MKLDPGDNDIPTHIILFDERGMLLLFRSGVETNPGPPPKSSAPIQKGIEAAFLAGSKKKRGRPKSADGEVHDKINDRIGEYMCECGKKFPRKRNLDQHQLRCPNLTARSVSPEEFKRRKIEEPKSLPKPSQNKPVTLFSEDSAKALIIQKSKYV